MIYSVYNTATKRYEYYQTMSGSSTTHAGAPARSLMAHQLGATPEQSSWSLPMGATKLGEGDVAVGRVAQRKSLSQFADISLSSISPWILIAGGAYLWWRSRR